MKNFLLLLLGLAALAILLLICSLPSVYGKAAGCSTEAFKANGISATAVHESKGLFSMPKNHLIRITGLLPESNLKSRAMSIFNNDCNGSWLNVNADGLTVAAPPPPPEPEPEPVVVVPSPYVLTATVSADRSIVLSGYVPDQAAMDAVVSAAAADYGVDRVTNNLEIIAGAPASWAATAVAAIDAIDPLENGRVEMRDLQVGIYGDAPDQPTSDGIQGTINGLVGAPYNTGYQITVPPPEVVAANTCQQDFNALLSSETINFESAKAVIAGSSYALLDQLAATAANCPEASMSIDGHTDSQGPDIYNQDLSERRAQAVVSYLIGQGVDSSRLTAIGYGETMPIADNETPEGRAINRRIEFSVQGI